jgi:hypothetical protein
LFSKTKKYGKRKKGKKKITQQGRIGGEQQKYELLKGGGGNEIEFEKRRKGNFF